jgi:hypothetical protein
VAELENEISHWVQSAVGQGCSHIKVRLRLAGLFSKKLIHRSGKLVLLIGVLSFFQMDCFSVLTKWWLPHH